MEFTPTEYFMDNDLYMILQCVGMGDMDMARDFTKSFCENHSDILPQDLTQWVLPRLDRDLITNIPAEIENLIVYEDVSKTFNINRYYVSKREKKLLKEIINLSKSGDLLSAAKIPFANTTLLIGPPGVGKTEFGRYLAFTMGLPFIRVDLRRIFGAQFGETGRNLQNIFKFVSTSRCLFMLDEIDAIGANRGTISTGGSGDEMTRTTFALMQSLDLLPHDVVLVAATNREDMMDKALRRRFSIRHEFKHFMPEELFEMVVKYLEDVNATGGLSLTWNDDDIKSQCSINTAQSDLIALTNRAIVRALRSDNMIKLKEEDKRLRMNR